MREIVSQRMRVAGTHGVEWFCCQPCPQLEGMAVPLRFGLRFGIMQFTGG
jgi:hypothetical protein